MIPFLVFVLLLGLLFRQLTGPRPLKWARRMHRLSPLFRWWRDDIRAVRRNAKAWREARKFRRQLRRTG